MPCLAKGAAMSGLLMLLLLGLLACAPLLSVCVAAESPAPPVPAPIFVLTEICHYPIDIDYIEHQFGNISMRVLPPEGEQKGNGVR